jgi:hypothetical protein
LIGGATFIAACVNGSTTEVPKGPFYTITLSVADSTSFPAGSAISVRATITHEAAAVNAVPVGWGVKKGDSTTVVKTTVTDTLGQTTFVWTLADTAGVNTLFIGTANDRADTLIVIGAVGKPAAILPVGLDSIKVAVRSPVTLQVRVTDRPGNNVVGTAVNWSTTGGTLSASTVPTATGGISQVTFSAATAGNYFVTAELPNQGTHTYQIVVQ